MQIEKIKFENVDFYYNEDKKIFENINMNIPLNTTFWLHGALGSGKGTFLKLIMGMVIPTKGSLFINDIDTSKCSVQEFEKYRKLMGFSFDTGGLIYNKTLLENLTLPLIYHRFCSKTQACERVMHYLEKFEIQEFKDMRPAFIPPGVSKLALLIRSLIHYPELVLWNNPTMGLDEDYFPKVIDLVREFQKEHGLKHFFVASEDFEFMNVFSFELMNFEGTNVSILGQEAA